MRGFGDTATARRYEPFSIKVDECDSVYDEWVLDKVAALADGGGWEITGNSGWTTLMPKLRHEGQPEPRVGDLVRVYGGVGRPIQGMTLNGTVLWYRWPEQREADLRRMREDMQAQGERDAERTRPKREQQYNALPECLRARIDRFRAERPEFATEPMGEGYELFIVDRARCLIEYFPNGNELLDWQDLNYDEQVDYDIHGFQHGQHSGNTHRAAVHIAYHYLNGRRDF